MIANLACAHRQLARHGVGVRLRASPGQPGRQLPWPPKASSRLAAYRRGGRSPVARCLRHG
jgi:hypothetical protein